MVLRLPDLSPTAWNTLRNLFAQGFGLLLFAVQAPLLGPHAFGLITLVMIFVGFCEHVLEIATTEALLALREPDRRHYATMTTAGGGFSIVLGCVVAAFAAPDGRAGARHAGPSLATARTSPGRAGAACASSLPARAA